MNHSEVVEALAERLDISKAQSKRMLKRLLRDLRVLLGKDIGFSIPDLGTFSTKLREKRRSFIPYYKRKMILPPKRVVVFSPSKGLKEEMKDVEVEE